MYYFALYKKLFHIYNTLISLEMTNYGSSRVTALLCAIVYSVHI